MTITCEELTKEESEDLTILTETMHIALAKEMFRVYEHLLKTLDIDIVSLDNSLISFIAKHSLARIGMKDITPDKIYESSENIKKGIEYYMLMFSNLLSNLTEKQNISDK